MGPTNTASGTSSAQQPRTQSTGKLSQLLWSIPLGWQLSTLYTLLLVLTLSLVGALVYTQQQDFLVQDASMRLEQAADYIMAAQDIHAPQDGVQQSGSADTGKDASSARGDKGGQPTGDNALHLDMLIRGLSGRDVDVAVLDTQGKVITSTQSVSGGAAPVIDPVTPQQVAGVSASNQPAYWLTRRADGTRYVVVLTSIVRPLSAEFDTATGALLNNSTVHVLEQSASLAAADAALSRLGTYLLLGVIFGTLAGLVLGTLFTRGILRPLDRVADTAEAIAEGDLQRRLQLPQGRNEVARLGQAFDHMVGRLVATLEAQRRFVADASHELRTPLTSLKDLAEILMIGAHGNDSKIIEQSAGAINGELERMIRLVTDLLTLSRFDNAGQDGSPPARRTRMDMCAAVQAAVTQMGPLAEARDARIEGQCGVPVWVVGDGGQLKQVLLNLLDNALRHTPAGGEVGVSAVMAASHTYGGAAMGKIEVWDTGSGIAEKDLPHIFERFYRGDISRTRATGNSGLGLSIVKTIIEAHDGTIEVQSSPGAGTRFTIMLPLARAASEQEAHTAASMS